MSIVPAGYRGSFLQQRLALSRLYWRGGALASHAVVAASYRWKEVAFFTASACSVSFAGLLGFRKLSLLLSALRLEVFYLSGSSC